MREDESMQTEVLIPGIGIKKIGIGESIGTGTELGIGKSMGPCKRAHC